MAQESQWLIVTRDPRGRLVRISRNGWKVHVVARKPEFADPIMLEGVRNTIEDPEIIRADRNHPRRECYYRTAPPPFGNQYLKVVIEFTRISKKGSLVTSYRENAHVPGEREVWRKL